MLSRPHYRCGRVERRNKYPSSVLQTLKRQTQKFSLKELLLGKRISGDFEKSKQNWTNVMYVALIYSRLPWHLRNTMPAQISSKGHQLHFIPSLVVGSSIACCGSASIWFHLIQLCIKSCKAVLHCVLQIHRFLFQMKESNKNGEDQHNKRYF